MPFQNYRTLEKTHMLHQELKIVSLARERGGKEGKSPKALWPWEKRPSSRSTLFQNNRTLEKTMWDYWLGMI
jgi:hypothetical protein